MNLEESILSDQTKIINIVMTQTTYSADEAKEKLAKHNNDYVKVIKEFMGIPEKKPTKIKSVNQEIYRQIRSTMDSQMQSYREKNPINIEHVRENFAEADSKLKLQKLN
jgi:hypothetical protein